MAWIETIPDERAEGKLQRLYDAARQRAGKVFNLVRVQSLNPGTLWTGIALYHEVMFGHSPLSRAQREMLAVVVSKANDCHYWVQAHSDDLRAEVEDEELVAAIRTDFRNAPIDEKTRGLLEFAERLTRTPGRSSRDDVERLRKLGWDDRAILDAVQVIAYFNYVNRIASGLGVDPEPEWPAETMP